MMNAPRYFLRLTTTEGPIYLNHYHIVSYTDGKVSLCTDVQLQVSESAEEITEALLVATRLRHITLREGQSNVTGYYEDEWERKTDEFDHFAPWRK